MRNLEEVRKMEDGSATEAWSRRAEEERGGLFLTNG